MRFAGAVAGDGEEDRGRTERGAFGGFRDGPYGVPGGGDGAEEDRSGVAGARDGGGVEVEDAGSRLGGREDGHKDQIIRLELVIRQSLKGVDVMAVNGHEVQDNEVVVRAVIRNDKVESVETSSSVCADATPDDVDALFARAAAKVKALLASPEGIALRKAEVQG